MAPQSSDHLAGRVVGILSGLTRRGRVLALGVAAMDAVAVVIALVLTATVTHGTARTIWLVVLAVLGVIVVGAPLRARAHLGTVDKRAPALVGELRSLLSRDDEARRTVIDLDASSPEVDSGPDAQPSAVAATSPALIGQARQFFTLREISHRGGVPELRSLFSSVAKFPGRVAVGVIGLVVFGVVATVLLLMWIF